MVKIVLHNQDGQSPYKKAILDITLGTCLINDNETIDSSLLKRINFSHPLLVQPILQSLNGLYCYIYDDLDSLLTTARYIYATLIQVDNPSDCQFKIAPSEHFRRLKTIYKIPFSLNPNKAAKEVISVNQLNAVISGYLDFKFQFQDILTIDESLSFKDLPLIVEGDALYETNPQIDQLINQEDDFKKYELRYINRFVGFGVYSRESIKEGDVVCFYSGVKHIVRMDNKAYFFRPSDDSLNMGIDARQYGNIARFINHAPKINKTQLATPPFLEANLVSISCRLYGIEVITYVATREILKGEQLLVDYGQKYFAKNELIRFKRNGSFMASNNRKLLEKAPQKAHILRIMAQNGIKQALWMLFKRPIIVLVIILLLTLFSFFARIL